LAKEGKLHNGGQSNGAAKLRKISIGHVNGRVAEVLKGQP